MVLQNVAGLFGGVNQAPGGIGMFEGLMGKGTATVVVLKEVVVDLQAGTFARGAGASALRVLTSSRRLSLGADIFKAFTERCSDRRIGCRWCNRSRYWWSNRVSWWTSRSSRRVAFIGKRRGYIISLKQNKKKWKI